MGKKIMIDCDVGVDDALALILAYHSPELEVKAITGVNGNVPLEQVFDNIQKVLSLIQPQQKPIIAKGADRPLNGRPIYSHSIHGKDGLGGAKIDRKEGEEWCEISSTHAVELIIWMARQYPNEITLIAIGPLTNLALAIQKDPEEMKKLKGLIIMGGAIRTHGNITAHAEFNIFSDPLAAKMVFESGLPIILVPLDVTHQVFLTSQLIEGRVRPIRNSLSRFLIEATGYDFITHQFRLKEIIHLHDPLAVGAAINPNLMKKERLSLDVETREGEYLGKISEVSRNTKVEVCVEVDAKEFLKLFLSRLG